jgi:hypothetical protein
MGSEQELLEIIREARTECERVLSGCRRVDEHRLFERDDDDIEIH